VATYEDRAKLLWSLSGSGLGTTISAAGNSGGFSDVPPAAFPSSAIGLSPVGDIGLFVTVGGTPTGTTPTLTVQLDLFDSLGNIFLQVAKTAAINSSGAAAPVYAGVRGGSAAQYIVFPQYGRISWAVTGTTPVFPLCEFQLWGR
jgi:hypothetical protein